MNKEIAPSIVGDFISAEEISGRTSRPRGVTHRKIPWIFLTLVVLPTLLASVYYLFIAAPLYVSEAQFVVHPKNQATNSGGLGSMLSSVGLSASDQEVDAYEVQEYMMSRNVIDDLIRTKSLRTILDRPGSDFLFRFPRPLEQPSVENLYQAYGRFVKVEYDLQSGISTLRVQTFSPANSQALANALLDHGEDWINRLNDRSLADALAQAQRQVDDAEALVVASQTAMTAYRNGARLIDPDKSAMGDLELIGKLQIDEATLKAQRAGLAASAPQSPQLQVMDKEIAAFEAQVNSERARTAGEATSLAPQLAEYERRLLDRNVADKTLGIAMEELESARLDARRQQLFLDRVVRPYLADKATEPRRLLTIFIVFLCSLVAYAILSLVIAGFREHQQI